MNNYELKIIISSRNEPTLSTGFNRQCVKFVTYPLKQNVESETKSFDLLKEDLGELFCFKSRETARMLKTS